MTIPSRFSDFLAVCLIRWRHQCADARLENLSDQGLKDIGIEPCHRDFDTVLDAVIQPRFIRYHA